MSRKRLSQDDRWAWIGSTIQDMLDDAPIKVFSASNCPLIPYRLTNVSASRPSFGERAGILILDSGVNQTVGNQQIIDVARSLGDELVDWVVPKDYPNDKKATIESLKEFKALAQGEFKGKLLIPIQGKTALEYVECYDEARLIFPDADYFGFGGIAKASPNRAPLLTKQQARLEAVMYLLSAREVPRLHLFGATNLQWLPAYLRDEVVSCDSHKFRNNVDAQQTRTGKHGGMWGYVAVLKEYLDFIMQLVNYEKPDGFGDFFR